jgi:SAM-dependent methyltransferase
VSQHNSEGQEAPSTSRHNVRDLYRHHDEGVRPGFSDREAANAYYSRYVSFVDRHLRRSCTLLDIGCGSGWSTSMFRQAGHRAFGLDLHAARLDAAVAYVAADAQRLPFRDGVFDAVAMHTVLEHLADPARALGECLRVMGPGGRLIVVGPNLLSVGVAAKYALLSTIGAIRARGKWTKRTPASPRHPFGNNLPEHWRFVFHHLWHTGVKLAGVGGMRFLMREPDPNPPFHADNDATYYCNPMDLLLWARGTPGVRAVRWWDDHRSAAHLLWPVTGGTWVVLEKAR